MTISPISREATSRSPSARSRWPMRSRVVSTASRATGRFSSALRMPARSLPSSNGWRVWSFLTTCGITSSAVSKVVKRSPQERHSRRRRIWWPSPASRESVTFVSSWLQNGQCTSGAPANSRVDGMAPAERDHRIAHAPDRGVVAHRVEDVGDQAADLARLVETEAARRDGGRPDPEAARHEWRARVVRHGILVHRDVRMAERRVGVLAGIGLADEIQQEQVIVRAAGYDAEPAVLERLRERARVRDHLPLVLLELRRERLGERNRLRGDHVHERAALRAGEDHRVELLVQLRVLAREDEPAARTP